MAQSGDEVEVVITYLEMTARPAAKLHPPANANIALIRAETPPVSYFLYLYGTVGAAHDWTDWFAESPAAQTAFVQDPNVTLFTLMVDGWPGGFFMLDTREAGTCDLAYFGLIPQALGRGLGSWLLESAIQTAWDTSDTNRLTVNTCTLDHPRALPLYQRMGFSPIRQQTTTRLLSGKGSS
ncbi:MAG: GNAT family N-acetyltransferase [Pseudomonadota bacterium]